MTALVLTTTTFTLERKKIFGSFFTATNELLLGLVDEKLTSFQYPLAFFASIPHYRSTPLREVSISMIPTLLTEGSHSSEPFFTQVNHLISSNLFSKQVINPADLSTLKIWDQSDHWFQSYGPKVNF